MVSIIVPVYKSEKTLSLCVESLQRQTKRDIEIILVDDGSPDNCPQICDALAREDARIQVIHKENGGVSSARNRGLDRAKGEFVLVVDSADSAELDMIEELLKTDSYLMKRILSECELDENAHVIGVKILSCESEEDSVSVNFIALVNGEKQSFNITYNMNANELLDASCETFDETEGE